MLPSEIEIMVEVAARQGRVLGARFEPLDDWMDATPWDRPPSGKPGKARIEGPIPATVQAVISHQIFVEKAGMPSGLLADIKQLFQRCSFAIAFRKLPA